MLAEKNIRGQERLGRIDILVNGVKGQEACSRDQPMVAYVTPYRRSSVIVG